MNPGTDRMKPFDYGMVYSEPMKNAWVNAYMQNPGNHEKNFVQRVNTMNPNTSMAIPTGNGRMTHRMASQDNRVFPTVEMKDGKLQELNRTGQPQETITTTTPSQALVLAWNEYKRANPDAFGYGEKPPSLLDRFSYGGNR